LRLVAAAGVLLIALVTAVYLWRLTFSATPAGWTCYAPKCPVKHEAWQWPVALLIAVAGLVGAVALVMVGRPRGARGARATA
jgi:hypothetical protein